MAFPTNIGSGRVIGTFGAFLRDGPDEDQEPTVVPAEGTITLTPAINSFTHTTAEGKHIIIGVGPVTIILNTQGEASTPKMEEPTVVDYEGARVWANDDPRNSTKDWTWTVTYKLAAAGRDLKIDPHPIAVLTGETVDLGQFIKVTSSPGVGIPQYQAAVFRAEAAAVAAAESAASGTGGTGTTDYTQLTNKPDLTVYAKTADLPAPPDLTSYALKTELHEPVDISGKADSNDARFTDARTPTAHTHVIGDVTGLTAALTSKLEAGALEPYAKTADLPADQDLSSYALKTDLHAPVDISGKVDNTDVRLSDARTPLAHTHTIANVTGLQGELDTKGTSDLELGTTAGTAKAGDYTPGYADLPAGTTLTVNFDDPRPTSRADIVVQFRGGTTRPTAALVGDIHLAEIP